MMQRIQVTLKTNMSGMVASDDFCSLKINSTTVQEIDEFVDGSPPPLAEDRSHNVTHSRGQCHESIPSNIFAGNFETVPQRRLVATRRTCLPAELLVFILRYNKRHGVHATSVAGVNRGRQSWRYHVKHVAGRLAIRPSWVDKNGSDANGVVHHVLLPHCS